MAETNVRRVPSETAFDLLEGSFTQAARRRLKNLLVVGVSVLVVAALAVTGLWIGTDNSALRNQIASEKGSQAALQKQLDQTLVADGYPVSHLNDVLRVRGKEALDAGAQNTDMTQVLTKVQAVVASSGATLAGLSVSPETAKVGVPLLDLTITSRSATFNDLTRWQSALKADPSLTIQNLTWTTNPQYLTVTTTLTMQQTVDSTLQMQLCSRLQLDPLLGCQKQLAAKPGATTAPAGQAQPGAGGKTS